MASKGGPTWEGEGGGGVNRNGGAWGDHISNTLGGGGTKKEGRQRGGRADASIMKPR